MEVSKSSTSRTQSRLLSLPPELRNKIYHHVLVSPTPIHLPNRDYCKEELTTSLFIAKPHLNPVCEPAFLSTCRQVRHESLAIFYGDNLFFSSLRGPLLTWLKAIGPEKRGLLRRVRGFRASRYFSFEWAVKFVKNVEGSLNVEGAGLGEGVFGVPFGVEGYDRTVFWVSGGCVDGSEVLASREGELEDCGRRFRVRIGTDGELVGLEDVGNEERANPEPKMSRTKGQPRS